VTWRTLNLENEYLRLTVLPDLGQPTKSKLEAAMKPHVIARAELVGTYQKRR